MPPGLTVVSASPQPSGNEKKLSRRLPGLKITMRMRGIRERINMLKTKPECAVNHSVKDVLRTSFKIITCCDVVLERRSRNVQRTHRGQSDKVERWNRTACSPK